MGDFSARFPAAAAVGNLPARSCVIDGEAIICDDIGLAVFELIRRRRSRLDAVLCAFDLIELDGTDHRREPIEKRERLLQRLLRGADYGIAYNEHFETDGAILVVASVAFLRHIHFRLTPKSRHFSAPQRTSGLGPGCVKTPKSNTPLEILSRLHQFEKQKRWRPLSGEDNSETNSARCSRKHIFTQPGPSSTFCSAEKYSSILPLGHRRSSDKLTPPRALVRERLKHF